MKQVFFRTGNLNSCLKRLANQYGILGPDSHEEHGPHDYRDDATDAESKANFNKYWPKSLGTFSTKLEQCEETGDYVFNLLLTDEQAASLPKVDNPNFTCQVEGEVDGNGDPLPLPTYKVENRDENGVGLGTYYDRTVCVMQ